MVERGRELSDFSFAKPLLFNRPCAERHRVAPLLKGQNLCKIYVLLENDG